MTTFSQLAFQRLTEAKKQFGEYNYHDKGASEVLDLDELNRELERLSDTEAVEQLLLLAGMDDTERLISDLLCDNQERDALFENETLANLL